ncbi:hypothetical protein GCM10009808_15440 [Microbacterium sediminicola]|uniref:Uncharacterized protein n=1 Tax=Microbacterium sediminicola TaxID=415210 RepID=A0ABP4U425_9MICO
MTTPDAPGEGWTLTGIAYTQIAMAHHDLSVVNALIRIGELQSALHSLSAIIRQLEAARRHIA